MLGKNFSIILSLLGFFVLILTSGARAENTVKLNTLDWEPYVGQKLPNNGFLSDFL